MRAGTSGRSGFRSENRHRTRSRRLGGVLAPDRRGPGRAHQTPVANVSLHAAERLEKAVERRARERKRRANALWIEAGRSEMFLNVRFDSRQRPARALSIEVAWHRVRGATAGDDRHRCGRDTVGLVARHVRQTALQRAQIIGEERAQRASPESVSPCSSRASGNAAPGAGAECLGR